MLLSQHHLLIAATVTDKLLPVYEKVAGAGSAVMSKVPRVGIGTGFLQEGEDNKGHNKDKGVSVMKYLVEKLRLWDEDWEMITGALHKSKEEVANPVGHEPTSEVFIRRMKNRRMQGRETIGEGEVARQLGRAIEDTREGDNAGKFGIERGTIG